MNGSFLMVMSNFCPTMNPMMSLSTKLLRPSCAGTGVGYHAKPSDASAHGLYRHCPDHCRLKVLLNR